MEPHTVVQAGAHERRVVPAHVVGHQDGVEERHVRGVGRHAGVQQRVLGQLAVGPEPQAVVGLPAGPLAVPGQFADVALVDGVGPLEPLGALLPPGLQAFEERRQGLGVGHVGHVELVLDRPLLVVVEGRLQVEDGPPVLNGDHPARGERLPVTDAVHLVEDGHGRVAGSQEVRVQGVDAAMVDRAPGGHEGLPGHLAAEDALALLVGLDTPEDVDLDRLEVEQVDEKLQRLAHAPHDRRR